MCNGIVTQCDVCAMDVFVVAKGFEVDAGSWDVVVVGNALEVAVDEI